MIRLSKIIIYNVIYKDVVHNNFLFRLSVSVTSDCEPPPWQIYKSYSIGGLNQRILKAQ